MKWLMYFLLWYSLACCNGFYRVGSFNEWNIISIWLDEVLR